MAKTDGKVHVLIRGTNQHTFEADVNARSTLQEILDQFQCRGDGSPGHRPHHPGSGDAYATGAGASTPQLNPSLPIADLPREISLR